MFAVTFGIWIKCKDGELDYGRLAKLPFVPYPGLEIEDDAFGEFKLLQVRWSGSQRRFYCFSTFTLFESHSIKWMKKRLKEAGWVKVEYDEVIDVDPMKDK